MLSVFAILSTGIALLIAIPSLVLLTQVLAAIRASGSNYSHGQTSGVAVGSIAVVVPAHNEALNVGDAITSIRKYLRPIDRIIVVADNCIDGTAKIAAEHGATAIERNDLSRKGKGYALAFGIEHLRNAPPDSVIFIDADCRVERGSLVNASALALGIQRPVQVHYKMLLPAAPALNQYLSALAWTIKNYVRPLGARNLGAPCQLMGSGMVFPWGIVADLDLETGDIVEDMKLGIDCAIAGQPPLFDPETIVSSVFPSSEEGRNTQSARWEKGHLSIIRRYLPVLTSEGLSQRKPILLLMALDLAVPPIVAYVVLLLACLIMSAALALISPIFTPMLTLVLGCMFLGLSIFLAWFYFGKSEIPGSAFFAIPKYVLKKLKLHLSKEYRLRTQWVRTKRDHEL